MPELWTACKGPQRRDVQMYDRSVILYVKEKTGYIKGVPGSRTGTDGEKFKEALWL